MKNKFREITIRFFAKFLPEPKSRAVILMYHSVGGNGKFFNVKPSDFESQMKFLNSSGYQVVTLPELCSNLRKKESLEKMVAITFDDGYSDFLGNALPVLKKHKFPATVFVITGQTGGDKMTREDLSSLADDPLVTLMPHTHTHPDLGKLNITEALSEINNSRLEIEKITGKPANILAYPKGKYTKELKRELDNSGNWLAAVTVKPGLVKSGDGLFELKRIPIDSAVSQKLFPSLLTRGMDLYESLKIWK